MEENSIIQKQKGMKEELKRRINAINLAGGGEDFANINFEKEVELDGATMYVANLDNFYTASFIVYEDGTMFHQDDWQTGHPDTAEDIADFEWLTEDGREAVVLDGLPHKLY